VFRGEEYLPKARLDEIEALEGSDHKACGFNPTVYKETQQQHPEGVQGMKQSNDNHIKPQRTQMAKRLILFY
jgi:hypothetical protein